MPARGSTPNQREILLKPLLLVVQQCPNRADIKDREAVPSLGKHLGNDREESRFGLAASRGCENDEVRPHEERINGQRLHVSQFPPTQGIDDVVLESRVQAVEGTHISDKLNDRARVQTQVELGFRKTSREHRQPRVGMSLGGAEGFLDRTGQIDRRDRSPGVDGPLVEQPLGRVPVLAERFIEKHDPEVVLNGCLTDAFPFRDEETELVSEACLLPVSVGDAPNRDLAAKVGPEAVRDHAIVEWVAETEEAPRNDP